MARTPYVRLLELLPELAADLDRAELAEARRLAVAPLTTLPEGQWSIEQLRDRAGTKCGLGCLVVDGLIVHEVVLGGRAATQLLGPGDLLAPAQPPSRLISAALRFNITEPVELAVLDDTFEAVTRRWPSIAAALIVRAERQAERAALQQAISQLPRAEQRIVALLWHLGDRWGSVADGHLAVPVSLGHEGIARLVGARRPTISAALGRLEASGMIIRQPDGTWLLSVDSRELLETTLRPSATPNARLISGRARSRRELPWPREAAARPRAQSAARPHAVVADRASGQASPSGERAGQSRGRASDSSAPACGQRPSVPTLQRANVYGLITATDRRAACRAASSAAPASAPSAAQRLTNGRESSCRSRQPDRTARAVSRDDGSADRGPQRVLV